MDLTAVTEELFYWLALCCFGNMAEMKVNPHISLTEMLQIAIQRKNKQEQISKPSFDDAIDGIMSRSEMLFDYFSIRVDEKRMICSFPVLISGYYPDWKKLPDFVFDLAFHVNWKKEKQCFDMCSKALAKLYAVTVDCVDRETVSSLIYPEIKAKLRPSSKLQSAISNLSAVPTLYRAFERC